MTNKLSLSQYLGLAFVLGAIALISLLFQMPEMVGASVDGESGYQATTTDTTIASQATVKTGQGLLGSVVITKTSNAPLSLYNATTTDINKRTGNTATSTITIASFPSTTVGTYVFDVNFTTGLIIDSGSTVGVASTTVTFK